jgi:GT2 family glycosyltransferase
MTEEIRNRTVPNDPSLAAEADVTVVISTFNRARFLPEAIDSILGQSLAVARVVVVDDGSTDETPDVLDRYRDRVDVVRLQNGGKARALNHVLPSIDTRYCWFFDDDDSAYPDALQKLMATALAQPDAVFVFGSWDLVETDGNLHAADKHHIPYRFGNEASHEQTWRLFRECTVMMTGALLRTDAVIDVGGLDENLLRGQDYDLMVKLAARGGFAYCGHCVYAWRQHAGDRGSKSAGHGASKRVGVWSRNAEPVGRYLREHVPLSSWVEKGEVQSSSHAHRLASFRRAWALAPKQALVLTIADIAGGLAAEPAQPLNEKERELLTHTLGHDFVPYRRLRHLVLVVVLPTTAVTSEVVLLLAKGCRWLASGWKEWPIRIRLLTATAMLAAWSRWIGIVHNLSNRSRE